MTSIRNRRAAIRALVLASASSLAITAGAAQAQTVEAEEPAAAEIGDIIVTARKKQESVLNVPVVANIVSGEALEVMQVNTITDLQKVVPGLNIGTATLSIGSIISLRGIGTSSQDAGVDQSVSVNIDGLSFSQGLAITSGMFDVQGVEVLKGPQALFYGKASPGGVISLRTADPTDKFEFIGRLGHEFASEETRGELIVSGPVTDTLGLRLAAMASTSEGYFKNTATPLIGSGAAQAPDRAGGADHLIIRGTALWRPSETFEGRLKLNYTDSKTIVPGGSQYVSCPDGLNEAPSGIPFMRNEDCKLDRKIALVAMDPASFTGISNGGIPYNEMSQFFGTFEGTWDLTPALTFTSTTGYYDLSSQSLMNTYLTTYAGTTLAIENEFSRKDFTQEFRLDSDFDTALNFTLGAFYQSANQTNEVYLMGNKAFPFVANTYTRGEVSMDIETLSAFGQARWQVLPQVELAAGARWTKETRSEDVTNLMTGNPVLVQVPEIEADNVAPEATITYRATPDLTLFGAWKKGFKSGSFSMSTIPAPGGNNAFGDEEVEGGEVGLKARLLDRTMNFNIAAYSYDYKGLQVGATIASDTGVPIIRTVNAGAAKAEGIDMDMAWYPRAVPNLALNAAVNWNKTKYTDFGNAPCYAGQLISEGCSEFRNPATGLYTAQNLTGESLVRAPEWEAGFGFDYDYFLSNGTKLRFSNSNKYSSSYYLASGLNRPNNDILQRSFFKANMAVTATTKDERWEFSVVGNNLTNEITTGNCAIFNAGNAGILGGQNTGGASLGPAGRSELPCWADQGRTVWLRVAYRH